MFHKTFGAIVAAVIAFISLAGAIIGITISATNLKNDFERSKARVAELEGQITALRGMLDNNVAGVPGPAGPPGPQGPKGDQGPGGAAAIDQNELRRIVTSVVRAELASQATTSRDAAAALPDNTGIAKAKTCFDVRQARSGAMIKADEGAIFCGTDGAIVMEVKDIDPTGLIAIGKPDDPGKICKECDVPWDKALMFQAAKVEQAGVGYTAMLEFRSR